MDEHYCDDVWCPEQGALFPQARIMGECGWIWSALVTAGPDTPVGVSGKDPTGACRGDEVGLLLWGEWILAHKVDGEHPTRYSNLLLAAQKLERWAKARDPLLPKTTPTGGSNVTHSQTSGNLFPSEKLKGSHTFTAQSAMVESKGVAEDLGTRQRRQKRLSLQMKRTQKPQVGLVEQISQLGRLSSILPTWIKLYQRKKQHCFGCGSPDHLVKDCLKGSQQDHPKSEFKCKRGDDKEGRLDP